MKEIKNKIIKNKWKILISALGVTGVSVGATASAILANTCVQETQKPKMQFFHHIAFNDGHTLFDTEFHPVPTTLENIANQYHIDVTPFKTYFNNDSPRISMTLIPGTDPHNAQSEFDVLTKDLWVRTIESFKTLNPNFDATQFEFITQDTTTGFFAADIAHSVFQQGYSGQVFLYDKIRNQYVGDLNKITFKALENKGNSAQTETPFYYSDSRELTTDPKKDGYVAYVQSSSVNDKITATNFVNQVLQSVRPQISSLTSVHAAEFQGSAYSTHGIYELNIAGLTDDNWQQYMQISTTADMQTLLTSIPQDDQVPLYVNFKSANVVEEDQNGKIMDVVKSDWSFTGVNTITVNFYGWSDLANYVNSEYGRIQSLLDFFPIRFGVGDSSAIMQMKMDAVMQLFNTNPTFHSHINAAGSPILLDTSIDTSKATTGTAEMHVIQPSIDFGTDSIMTQLGGLQSLIDLNFHISYIVEPQDHMYSHPFDSSKQDADQVIDSYDFVRTIDHIYSSDGTAIDWKTGAIKWDFDRMYQWTGSDLNDISSQFSADHVFSSIVKDEAQDSQAFPNLEQDSIANEQLRPDGTLTQYETIIEGRPQFVATDDGEYNEIISTTIPDYRDLWAAHIWENDPLFGGLVKLADAVKNVGKPVLCAVYQNFSWEHSSQGEWTAVEGSQVHVNDLGQMSSLAIMGIVLAALAVLTIISYIPEVIDFIQEQLGEFEFADVTEAIAAKFRFQVSPEEFQQYLVDLDDDSIACGGWPEVPDAETMLNSIRTVNTWMDDTIVTEDESFLADQFELDEEGFPPYESDPGTPGEFDETFDEIANDFDESGVFKTTVEQQEVVDNESYIGTWNPPEPVWDHWVNRFNGLPVPTAHYSLSDDPQYLFMANYYEFNSPFAPGYQS